MTKFIVTEDVLWTEGESGKPAYSPRTGTRYEIAPGIYAKLKRLTHGLQKRCLEFAAEHDTALFLDEVDDEASHRWDALKDDLRKKGLDEETIANRRPLRSLSEVEADAIPYQYEMAKMICDCEEWPDVDDIIPKVIIRINRDFTRGRSATAPPERPLSPGQLQQLREVLTPLIGAQNGA